MNTKPTPTSTIAAVIFAGVLGSRRRRASQVHSAANNGAVAINTAELIDWNQVAGILKPPSRRLVRSSAKKFIDEAACSKAIQNGIENAITTSRAVSRS